MATDPFLLRLFKGNATTPLVDQSTRISVHHFTAAVSLAYTGQITRAALEADFDINTVGEDATDLDGLIAAAVAAGGAGLFSAWLHEFHNRLLLAEDKTGLAGLDGRFGLAVKTTFLQGADGVHDLRSDVTPVARRFVNWAAA